MSTALRVFLGALVIVPITAAVAVPTDEPAAVAVGAFLLVVMLGTIAFGVWVDTVLYFGGGTDDEQSTAASSDSAEPAASQDRCSDCGRAVPDGRDRCEGCGSVGSWRK